MLPDQEPVFRYQSVVFILFSQFYLLWCPVDGALYLVGALSPLIRCVSLASRDRDVNLQSRADWCFGTMVLTVVLSQKARFMINDSDWCGVPVYGVIHLPACWFPSTNADQQGPDVPPFMIDKMKWEWRNVERQKFFNKKSVKKTGKPAKKDGKGIREMVLLNLLMYFMRFDFR